MKRQFSLKLLQRLGELVKKPELLDKDVAAILTREGHHNIYEGTVANVFRGDLLITNGVLTKAEKADIQHMRMRRGAQKHGPAFSLPASYGRTGGVKPPHRVAVSGDPINVLSKEEREWAANAQAALEARMPHIHDHHAGCAFDTGGHLTRGGACGKPTFGRLMRNPNGHLGIKGSHLPHWCVVHGYLALATPGRAKLRDALDTYLGVEQVKQPLAA